MPDPSIFTTKNQGTELPFVGNYAGEFARATLNGVARRGHEADAQADALTIVHNGTVTPYPTTGYFDDAAYHTGIGHAEAVNYSTSGEWARELQEPSPIANLPDASPTVTIYPNASFIQVKTPKKMRVRSSIPSNKVRGIVRRFSRKSRSRMMQLCSKIPKDHEAVFQSLTYPAIFPDDATEWKRHLKVYCQRLKRYLVKFDITLGDVWKLEPQKRLAPHFHLLLYGTNLDGSPTLGFVLQSLIQSVAKRFWYEIVNSGDTKHRQHGVDTQLMRSYRGVRSYVTKYMGKVVDETGADSSPWGNPGRYWGTHGTLPITKPVVVKLTYKQCMSLRRWLRRFSGLPPYPGANDPPTMTLSVENPQVWLDNILTVT